MIFLSAEEIRAAEKHAMERTSSMQLIGNAANACFEELKTFNSVLVYCGKGNNGSDGYATAILLRKAGKRVCIVQVEEPKTPECAALCSAACDIGIEMQTIGNSPKGFECIFDAIFGIGIKGTVTGNPKIAIEEINAANAYVVSADIPSGMDADTGEGVCVKADKTITFTAPKKGMIYNQCVNSCGEIVIKEVGIQCPNTDGVAVITNDLAKKLLPKRERLSHKGTYGTAVIIAGSKFMAGAAAMAAQAAQRSGCGMVKIIAPWSICASLNIMVKEAVIISVPEKRGVISPRLNKQAIAEISKADSVLIGCGIGKGHHEKMIGNVLKYARCPVIIDADGINALSGHLDIIKNKNVLLTPHPLEFSRISSVSVPELEKNRPEYADVFVKQTLCNVLLKGARTVIVNKDGKAYVSLISTSALAKAGSGDALAGICASLAAQGLNISDSAVLAVYLHALAGTICERKLGAYSTTSGDLIENISEAFKTLTFS
ncbi:MAG: NAD(P)H-hydrate dehydratase [Clostridia bacterium]|nr:NAD(P)H-hydrate dehydratase [Clostridia bacterium]